MADFQVSPFVQRVQGCMHIEHLVETSPSCTLNIKLSTKNLRCFYTATATEKDVTSKDCHIIIIALEYIKSCPSLSSTTWTPWDYSHVYSMYALGCSACSAHSSLGCCIFLSRTVNPIVYKLHASLPYRIRCDDNFLCIILADWLFQKFILQSLVYKDVGHSRISTVEPLIVDTPNSGHLCLTDSRSTPCIFTLLADSVDSLVKKKAGTRSYM